MKITYRREMKHNYLIVDPESLTWRNYECRMLAANSIEGVLHFQIRQVDDEIRFYYEITSRQPLDRMLESQSVRMAELRSLVFGISHVLDRMEQYLLREGSVLLKPEYIYVEPETFRIWLCLVPGLERNFPEDYGKLLEYLLGKVDHQDKDSVVLAYGLYQETRKENYGMEDILRLFRAETGAESQPEEQTEPEEPPEREEPGQVEKAEKAGKPLDMQKEDKGKGLWGGLRAWWSRRRRAKEPESVRIPWEMMFHEEKEKTDRDAMFSPKEPPFMPENRTAPEAERFVSAVQPGRDTVLLADLTPENHTKLHYLRSLDWESEDIAISYYPFIIGKQENLVDFLLLHDTISRLHLRIDREGSQYFLQDLNSTNGTTVAGHLLENNESTEVRAGDEVHIARYRYRFE